MAHRDSDNQQDIRKHPQDTPLRCSPRMFRDFAESAVWQDMLELIEDRIELLRTELEAADDMEAIRYLQGQITELRAVSVYPQYLEERSQEERQTDE